jgi:hypothetical protein
MMKKFNDKLGIAECDQRVEVTFLADSSQSSLSLRRPKSQMLVQPVTAPTALLEREQ